MISCPYVTLPGSRWDEETVIALCWLLEKPLAAWQPAVTRLPPGQPERAGVGSWPRVHPGGRTIKPRQVASLLQLCPGALRFPAGSWGRAVSPPVPRPPAWTAETWFHERRIGALAQPRPHGQPPGRSIRHAWHGLRVVTISHTETRTRTELGASWKSQVQRPYVLRQRV